MIVLGGGNTRWTAAVRSATWREDVKVIVRSPFADMKASPWEKEDAMHEDIPIIDNHVPKSFVIEDGRLRGVMFEKVEAVMTRTASARLSQPANRRFFIRG